MELIFELLFELFGQLIVELIFEAGFRGAARILSNRVVRAVLAVGAGFGGGYWWGWRLTEIGRTDPPNALWVSIGLAVAFTAAALVKARTGEGSDGSGTHNRAAQALLPWRWSASRLAGFALVNAAVATGVAAGFTPKVPG